jgi:hypothetical protein
VKIEDLLREAGREGRSEGCRPQVEDRLISEFRRKNRKAAWPAWMAVAAACVALAWMVARVPEPAAAPVAQEVRTEFFALDPLAEEGIAGAYVVRVKVPQSTMASFGIPVNADHFDQRVDADLLVSSDGAARAIRFVRTDFQ